MPNPHGDHQEYQQDRQRLDGGPCGCPQTAAHLYRLEHSVTNTPTPSMILSGMAGL